MPEASGQPPLSEAQRGYVTQWLPRAEAVARKLAMRVVHMCPGLDVDDVRQVAYEALVEAARRYDPEAGVPFWGYAKRRVEGAVFDAMRKDNPAVRAYRRALHRLEAQQRAVATAARDAQAAAAGTDVRRRVAEAAEVVRIAAAGVLARRLASAETDQLPSEHASPEQAAIHRDLLAALRRALAALPPAETELYRRLYVEGTTMAALASEQGISVSTVCRRHARMLQRLARALEEDNRASRARA